MPSPEEFGGGESAHGVGAAPRTASGAPDIEALKARARAVRQAQATGVPIPGTGVSMVQPVRPVPVQAPTQWQPAPAQTNVSIPTPSVDEELELVRARFKLASYYEALIEQPAFGDDVFSDPYAAQVQHELTEWVKGRMMELTGVRNNPEGFLDEEVQLLKSLAQGLSPNGVRALMALVERLLNPTPPPAPVDLTPPAPAPAALRESPAEDEDQGGSAGFLAPPPAPPPAPPAAAPQVVPAKPRRPYVRRARVPGAPVAATAVPPQSSEPAEPTTPPQKRTRKRSADPLAAGKAAVASAGQPETDEAPTAPAAPAPAAVQPVPMPRGLSMSMAMEQKAGEALRSAQVIQATGGGVL